MLPERESDFVGKKSLWRPAMKHFASRRASVRRPPERRDHSDAGIQLDDLNETGVLTNTDERKQLLNS
jgi:hypothetical protein